MSVSFSTRASTVEVVETLKKGRKQKILFHSLFCLLQTSDERIFQYSRIYSGSCRNFKKRKKTKNIISLTVLSSPDFG